MTGEPTPASSIDIEARKRFLASLMQTQWLSETDLARYQRRSLERMVRHAFSETDYYRDTLGSLFNSDRTIDWKKWRDVPVLTREMVQADPESLFARSVPKQAGQCTEIRTSGSTGRPIRILWDQFSGLTGHMLDARFHEWHGIEADRSLAVIKSYLDRANLYPNGGRSKCWHVQAPDADVFALNTAATIDQQIEWLERIRPDYLMSYPSNILEIAKTMGAGSGRALGLRACLSFGETVSDDMQSIVEDLLSAPMLDRYGSTEVGQVSAQCPSSARHHVSMENVYLEILDENNQPVMPGVPGRVIVTGFSNFSMPFIRYDLGDYAVLSSQPCRCGRNLISIERILGRARSIFRFNDGSSKFPYIKVRDVMQVLPHRQLQVAQTRLDRVEIRYVPEKTGQTIDMDGLVRIMRKHLHDSLTIDIKPVSKIDRAPGGKFFGYVSELEE